MRNRHGRDFTPSERFRCFEIVHELLNSNILMPARDPDNVGWPWLSVTSHGREVLADVGPPVYDYDGYLAGLRRSVTDLDKTVEKYLRIYLTTA